MSVRCPLVISGLSFHPNSYSVTQHWDGRILQLRSWPSSVDRPHQSFTKTGKLFNPGGCTVFQQGERLTVLPGGSPQPHGHDMSHWISYKVLKDSIRLGLLAKDEIKTLEELGLLRETGFYTDHVSEMIADWTDVQFNQAAFVTLSNGCVFGENTELVSGTNERLSLIRKAKRFHPDQKEFLEQGLWEFRGKVSIQEPSEIKDGKYLIFPSFDDRITEEMIAYTLWDSMIDVVRPDFASSFFESEYNYGEYHGNRMVADLQEFYAHGKKSKELQWIERQFKQTFPDPEFDYQKFYKAATVVLQAWNRYFKAHSKYFLSHQCWLIPVDVTGKISGPENLLSLYLAAEEVFYNEVDHPTFVRPEDPERRVFVKEWLDDLRYNPLSPIALNGLWDAGLSTCIGWTDLEPINK